MTTQNATVSDGKKSHRATSNHDRRRARQDQHASRLGAKRTTRRTPQEIFDKIRSLLLLGHTQMAVKDTLRDQGYEISLGPIGKVTARSMQSYATVTGRWQALCSACWGHS